MYPTVSYFIKDFFGVYIPLPIQTYGFFMAIAFVVNIFILIKEFKRKEAKGLIAATAKVETIGLPAAWSELLLSGIGWFLIGFKGVEALFHYSDFANSPQDFILSGRGNWLGAIVLAAAGVYMKYREKEKERLPKPKKQTIFIRPHEHVGNIIMIGAGGGILGSKLFHILENMSDFLADPMGLILTFSGLSFYGGLIVAGVAIAWYGIKNNIKPLHMADTALPSVALGYGIGRLGCHFSGDGCWGVANAAAKPFSWLPDWLWAYDYPHNVINYGSLIENCSGGYCRMLDQPVYPTAVYESLLLTLVFFILWFIRPRVSLPGVITGAYLILAGFERFFIEKIRVNNKYHIGSFEITQAEIISSVSILLGVALLVYVYKNKDKIMRTHVVDLVKPPVPDASVAKGRKTTS